MLSVKRENAHGGEFRWVRTTDEVLVTALRAAHSPATANNRFPPFSSSSGGFTAESYATEFPMARHRPQRVWEKPDDMKALLKTCQSKASRIVATRPS
jgi:hypothetical protein